MKSLKKIFRNIITFVLVFCAISLSGTGPYMNFGIKAYAATNPYGKYQTFNNVETIRCTWYAWEQVYNNQGIAMRGWGHARDWSKAAQADGYQTGSIPKVGSIACYSGGAVGHVAYVTKVLSNDSFEIVEGGNSVQGRYSEGICRRTIQRGKNWPNLGFIYMPEKLNPIPIDKYMATNRNGVPCRFKYYKEGEIVKRIENYGTTVHLVMQIINKWGDLWYKTDDGYWKFSGNLNNLRTYKISYDNNGGQKGGLLGQLKSHGEDIRLDVTGRIRKGYVFEGWSENRNAITATYKPGATYSKNKNTTLYAVWRKSETSISIDKCGMFPVANVPAERKKQANLTVTGYVPTDGYFNVRMRDKTNMYCTVSPLNVTGFFSKKGTANIEVTGLSPVEQCVYIDFVKDERVLATTSTYVIVSNLYTISYNANGGTGAPAPQTRYSTDKDFLLSSAVPKRTGFTFMGWAKSSNASSAEYGSGDNFREDRNTTLYAVWAENYGVTHRIVGDTLYIDGNGDMACYSPGGAPWYNDRASISNVYFEGTVRSIGSYAFYNMNFTTVRLSSTITLIRNNAFENCKNLRNINLSSTVKRIGSNAFKGCSFMKDFVWNNSKAKTSALSGEGAETKGLSGTYSYLGSNVFEGCTGLTDVMLPDDLTEMGNGVFQGCTSLETIDIPDEINEIGDLTFFNCTSLANVEISQTTSAIYDGAFQGCVSLENFEIPDSVTELGKQAFSGCSALSSINIPENIETIGDGVFSNCTSLTQVSFPGEVTFLGNAMFSGCSALERIDLPENIYQIGDGTFLGCESLTEINIPENVEVIGNSTFLGCNALTQLTIPEKTSLIGDYAFFSCKGLEEIDFGTGVKEIGECAFAQCSALEEAILPDGVTEIGNGAFMDCSNLKYVSTGASDVNIGEEAFSGCNSLENAIISKYASSVGTGAFENCNAQITCYIDCDAYPDIQSEYSNLNVIVPVKGVELSGNSTDLTFGNSIQLEANVSPAGATNKNIEWLCCNDDVASVDENGLVTAWGTGVAIVQAKAEDGELYAEYEINCSVPVSGIQITRKCNMLVPDMVVSMEYDFTPNNPTEDGVIWSSSNPEVADFNGSSVLETKQEGTTTISAVTVDGGFMDSFVLMVSEKFADFSSLVKIRNQELNKERKVDYKTTIKFTAEKEELPVETQVQWFINGEHKATGTSYTAEKATKSFEIHTRLVTVEGDLIAESEPQKIIVKAGFFDRLIAFFRGLFRRLPVIEQ